MKDDREKLIELMGEAFGICMRTKCKECRYDNLEERISLKCQRSLMVDYLMSHGVTVQKWIPASEPPKDPGEYIVKIPAGTEATTLFWDGKEWFDVVGDEVICYNISAWMPLPEPPEEDGHGPAE